MINMLRTYLPDGGSGTNWQPQHGPFLNTDVCLHGSIGPVRDGNTTSSMVVRLDKKHPTVFITGTASPCTSIFKPVWIDVALPDIGPAPSDEYDPHSLFWQHELLHRATIQDFQSCMAAYAADRDTLKKNSWMERLPLPAPRQRSAQSIQQTVLKKAMPWKQSGMRQ